MKITFYLPHGFWKVLSLRAKEIEEKQNVKYDPNILCRDLAIGYVQNQPEYKKAMEILGRNKDRFEV